MPSQVTLRLIESVRTKEVADYKLGRLALYECVSFIFDDAQVAVLICNIGGGMYRVAARRYTPEMAKQLE
mgnify:CR=1 FL=1